MAIRLEPADEYLHELGPESTFNESMYFNVYDPTNEVGAFFRVGNRANEGYAEMTVCVYLPDGRVAFMFQRPEVSSNEAFDAGGLRFAVVEPFETLTVSYEGSVLVLAEPKAMVDPRAAFTQNPTDRASVELTFTRVSDMVGGESDEPEREGEEFARGHYEQLVQAHGHLSVGPHRWELAGFGLRDHSWGPRTWQAPFYYRWLTCNAGADFGFMGSRIARRDRDGVRAGFVWEGGRVHRCDGFRIETGWEDEEHYHATIEATLSASDTADGPKSWDVSGEVLSLIPLRNRREGQVTRISEGLTRWTIGDRVGYGLSEYLDQLIDGMPVGIDE